MRLSAMVVPPPGAGQLLHVPAVGGLDLRGELFLTEDPQRGRRDALWGEPEMLEDFAPRPRSAEAIDTDDGPALPDEALPAECGAGLDGDARHPGWTEHALAVGVVPLIEQLPRGHADDPRVHA